IIPFLTEIDRLSISCYDFHFSKDKILEHFEKRPSAETFDSSTVNIGGDNLDTQMLPAYAAALTSLTNGIGHLDIEIVQSNVQEFFHKQLFNRTLPLMLYMLFGILLANTFFYYHFKSKNETYRSLLSQKKHELTSLDSLKNHVKQQQEFFHQTNINQSMQASFYADRIGASIPKGIQLIEL